jgi:hypothetical protein
MATGMIGRDQAQPETLTRSELAELRGGLDGGAGWGDSAARPPNGKEPLARIPDDPNSPDGTGDFGPPSVTIGSGREQTVKCQGCGAEIDGRPNRKWCSAGCRARFRRSEAPTMPQVPRNGQGMDDSPSGRPAVVPGDLFEVLQGLPLLLRSGWALQADTSAVTLRWSHTGT